MGNDFPPRAICMKNLKFMFFVDPEKSHWQKSPKHSISPIAVSEHQLCSLCWWIKVSNKSCNIDLFELFFSAKLQFYSYISVKYTAHRSCSYNSSHYISLSVATSESDDSNSAFNGVFFLFFNDLVNFFKFKIDRHWTSTSSHNTKFQIQAFHRSLKKIA